MNDNQLKFQNLLRELFQFDCADLDFGIYRIMNHKRAVIEKFITEDLPQGIREELEKGALAEQEQAMQALQKAQKKVLEALGDNALDANGQLSEAYRSTNAGKDYLAAQQQAAKSQSREALENTIYNHLYTFFSRYWQEGDFISKRRYSKKERYAIPYNGEEVYLYWANQDQYYVKTGEYFTDYTYKGPNGITVDFKLQQANVEQNNIKGEKRFFLPRIDEIVWDEEGRQLIIPFEYRPLREQEAIAYGQKNQQEAIIAKAVAEIPKRVKAQEAIAALTAEKRNPGNADVSFALEYHLHQYTRRNTSDFFIHKDLKGFLSRELDFYLKNEVLNLEELEAAGEGLSEGWFQLLQLIKRIGLRIIEFLAQIEEFQKMLWEKRKFVTETFYLITVSNVPEAFYPEIAACQAQWGEWQVLFDLEAPKDNKKRIELLKTHPTLVLDTRHFPQNFTDRLLASFDDVDESTDGLLVHAENWQALNLLQEKYREQVKCIYIDPPYNTAASEILYKNDYRHSSWIAMMIDRLILSARMLPPCGVIEVAIDDTETSYLRDVLDKVFGEVNRVATITAEVNPAGQNLRPNTPALSHDYCHVYAADIDAMEMLLRELTEEESEIYKEQDDKGSYIWDNLRRRGGNSRPSDRPGQWFPLFITENIVRVPNMEWDELGKKWLIKEKPLKEEMEVWPIDPRGEKRIWRVNPEGARRFIELGEIAVTVKAGRLEVVKKSYMPQGKKPKTLWKNPKYSATTHGTKLLIDILGKQLFSYPKSLYLVIDCLRFWSDEEANILDFFAGSGTTGHAVINLNREDGGRRKFILVEMAQYFDTVLLPRIKKVAFTPEWKDGKPKRMATQEEAERSPRIVKVIRLESYEDALNNLTFEEQSGQQALKVFRDEYLLSYMLKWETRQSETLLNVEQLQAPFSYKLHLHRDGETRERPVDLPETFAYLLGLDVQTRRVYDNCGRRYLVYCGTLRNGRTVVILWRDITGWGVKDYECEADFVAQQNLTAGADEIYVNGDSRIPGARSLDPIFKERMFEPVEV